MTTASEQRNINVNLDAERAVLGSILIDPIVFAEVDSVLSDKDFWLEANQHIYRAMTRLDKSGSPIDIITLEEELARVGSIDTVGGMVGLMELSGQVPTGLYASHYAKIVKDKSTMRSLTMAAQKIAGLSYTDDPDLDVSAILDNAESLIAKVTSGSQNGSIYSLGDALSLAISSITSVAANPDLLLKTGYFQLDSILNGVRSGDMVVIAGRPSMGKSAFALNIAQKVCEQGKRVALFSLEMSKEQLSQRFLSMKSGVDNNKIRSSNLSDDDWDRMLEAANVLHGFDMYMDDTAGITVSEIRAKCRRLMPLDLVIVDYMQLMTSPTGNKNSTREQEVSHISRSMKVLAREFNCPVIALSQLSRSPEQRQNKRPMLSDLRESGSIEQDSDMVLLLYRDDYYNEETDHANIVEVNVAKNRNGGTGTVNLFFRKELGQFRDLELRRTEYVY